MNYFKLLYPSNVKCAINYKFITHWNIINEIKCLVIKCAYVWISICLISKKGISFIKYRLVQKIYDLIYDLQLYINKK